MLRRRHRPARPRPRLTVHSALRVCAQVAGRPMPVANNRRGGKTSGTIQATARQPAWKSSATAPGGPFHEMAAERGIAFIEEARASRPLNESSPCGLGQTIVAGRRYLPPTTDRRNTSGTLQASVRTRRPGSRQWPLLPTRLHGLLSEGSGTWHRPHEGGPAEVGIVIAERAVAGWVQAGTMRVSLSVAEETEAPLRDTLTFRRLVELKSPLPA